MSWSSTTGQGNLYATEADDRVAIEMVQTQGGVFRTVPPSEALLTALEP